MAAPTLAKKTVAPQAGAAKVPPVIIPFTRAARKKSRVIGSQSFTPGASVQPLAPIQLPAAGYLRKLEIEVSGVCVNNIVAGVAFSADGPFPLFNSIGVLAANGDTIHANMSGFTWSRLQKLGAFSADKGHAPESDPTYSVTTGNGASAGSFSYVQEIPFEIDERDALGALPNMASNQSFTLNLAVGTLAQIYSTAPTNAPTVTITITMHYWAVPAAVNSAGVAQATAPLTAGTFSILQSQQPAITAGTDQTLQSANVGNTVRFVYFELRTAAGVRTDVDFPALFNLLVNNDIWMQKRKTLWQRQIGNDYGLTGAPNANPTAGALDNGVYIIDDFINGGSQGKKASGSSNRDELLVTASATALDFEFNQFGANASQLIIVTNSLKVADSAALYAPKGV